MIEDLPHRPRRLLIVDDDPGVRRLFARILESRGYEVHTASNADAGLHEIGTARPDAVLLDLRMPLINGFGFLYRVRADQNLRDLPVAIVTGDRSLGEGPLAELRALGADVWHKPLSPEQLGALVNQLLSGSGPGTGDGTVHSDPVRPTNRSFNLHQ